MQISQRPLRVFTRTAAVFALATATTFCLHAQQVDGAEGSYPAASSFAQPAFSTASLLLAANNVPDAIGYSTSAGATETESAVSYMSTSLAANPSPQPPPRRYGRRPVYSDSHHNADGSNKYTFFGGGGVSLPTGGTNNYLSTGYNVQVGGGRNFNKKLALLAQFDFNHFGLQTNTLNNLLSTYQTLCGTSCSDSGTAISQIGGTNHIWSFTVDPMYTYMDHEKFGGYVIGGVGFYHKVTDFTTPATGEYCDPYYGCYEYQANQTIDSYVSNAFGANGGLGFTYKGSRFSDLKFYAEARYVYTANSRRPYYDGTTGTSLSSTYFNVFPQNSAPTTYIPITFGVRF